MKTFDWSSISASTMRSGDRTLASYVGSLGSYIISELDKVRPNEQPPLKKLFGVFKNSAETDVPFYTRKNSVLFHSFVVSAFIAYGRSIRDIEVYTKALQEEKRAEKRKRKKGKEVQGEGERVCQRPSIRTLSSQA